MDVLARIVNFEVWSLYLCSWICKNAQKNLSKCVHTDRQHDVDKIMMTRANVVLTFVIINNKEEGWKSLMDMTMKRRRWESNFYIV